jgi:hypothetical protein
MMIPVPAENEPVASGRVEIRTSEGKTRASGFASGAQVSICSTVCLLDNLLPASAVGDAEFELLHARDMAVAAISRHDNHRRSTLLTHHHRRRGRYYALIRT